MVKTLYRQPLEIQHDILKTCKSPKIISNITRIVNISHKPLAQYLDMMIHFGLVTTAKEPNDYDIMRNVFITTKKGHRAIDDIEKALSYFSTKILCDKNSITI